MKLTIIGTGYVGLVSGACLAEVGNDVFCLDLDADKVAALQAGRIPLYEPGLTELVQRNLAAGRLRFSTDVAAAVAFGTLQIIAVGTPASASGEADVSQVWQAARAIGQHMTDYKVVIGKSTVPVGTADQVKALIAAELAQRAVVVPYAVVSNPEFLKEGAAVEDFMRPDRIILGSEDERATLLLRSLYQPFQRNRERLLLMDVRSAELTKYAANAMLATRISFMNELANLAEVLGADIEQVRHGMGSDPRIGYDFLYAGLGYGGSCFPKDVRALRHTAAQHEVPLRLLGAVEQVNRQQRLRLVAKLATLWGGDWQGKRLALWGLAFKPNTDDMREAPSLAIIEAVLARGASVLAYDPVAMPATRALLGEQIGYADSPMAALHEADALLIATEWKEFRSPDFEQMRALLRAPLIMDGRNLYEPKRMRELGFVYHGIGR
ncbi:UDP-glucose dehydrogenase family protein [Chitinimonas taiwanensis]|uniref:UDP-glucose 6-dehydrogenase n=1 Tax=Chitinimonas taiwanensis DSM 18899 TaxID=1121279 RepID=A0A1K2H814_9NEIS|nr:UDP-glucose/GDP-mannose dehydrogenase family protein [Chitinimonas taiwanensis]SFZ72764.1 UDP-glucose dehydrogenase [Chitinimonas taiwanensis DSM 18899]